MFRIENAMNNIGVSCTGMHKIIQFHYKLTVEMVESALSASLNDDT